MRQPIAAPSVIEEHKFPLALDICERACLNEGSRLRDAEYSKGSQNRWRETGGVYRAIGVTQR